MQWPQCYVGDWSLQPSPSGCFGKWPTLASEGTVLEKPDLIVVVQGDEIIVRTLGFHATYDKSIDQPQLIMREHASFWFASCPTQPTRGPHKQALVRRQEKICS